MNQILYCYINHKGLSHLKKHQVWKKSDFILILQTPLQEDMLLNFGSNIICMDDTHGTNSYDFSLITFLVVDEYGEGFPAAWCLCNRTDKYILIDCLMAVRKRVGNINQSG